MRGEDHRGIRDATYLGEQDTGQGMNVKSSRFTTPSLGVLYLDYPETASNGCFDVIPGKAEAKQAHNHVLPVLQCGHGDIVVHGCGS